MSIANSLAKGLTVDVYGVVVIIHHVLSTQPGSSHQSAPEKVCISDMYVQCCLAKRWVQCSQPPADKRSVSRTYIPIIGLNFANTTHTRADELL